MDNTSWPTVQALLRYWNEYPPAYSVLKTIAMGLGAKFQSTSSTSYDSGTVRFKDEIKDKNEAMKLVAELQGMIQGSGLNFGVIHGRG